MCCCTGWPTHVGTVVDRLQQSQLEVLRAEQMAALGHLAAGLAHELRNPLTAMKILVQKAAKARPGQRTDRPRPGCLGSRDGTSGAFDPDIPRFCPAAHVRETAGGRARGHSADLGTGSCPRRRQCVQIRCDLADRPLMIEADHEQLRQLFLNLLCNALDTLPQGGSIRIAAANPALRPDRATACEPRMHNRSTSWITITVADNGPGVPEDLGDRIFEPYVSTKDTGIGLGLAICRRIVQSHGGEIIASNRPGRRRGVHGPPSEQCASDQHCTEVPD